MGSFEGRVEKINKVSYISPEGAVHFEAVIVFDNPGTLTAEMDASAVLTAADGTAIYPYENGKTEYYESRDIIAKASGPVTAIGNLLDHANVQAGEALLYLAPPPLIPRSAPSRRRSTAPRPSWTRPRKPSMTLTP